jgi:AcrR family transcriptional regulator
VTITVRPERGTRPPNRRDLIVAAATELFCVRGYEHVSMGDIAHAVAVGPSALYRHFASKQELLEAVVSRALESVATAATAIEFTDPGGLLLRMAELVSANRHLGILAHREVRHLSPEVQDRLRRSNQVVATRVAGSLNAARPDLTADIADLFAWSVLGVVVSPSFYQTDLSAREQPRLVAALASRVLSAPSPEGFALAHHQADSSGLLPYSRREALLQRAIQLFAERRYASVGVEDVAATLGITGSSVYSHFASKADLLADALNRSAAYLRVQASDVLAASKTPQEALGSLVTSYAEFALAHPALVDLLVSEVRNLPAPQRESALDAQREYVGEWVHLLEECRPELSGSVARMQIQAVLALINAVARIPHLQSAVGVSSAVAAICQHVLDLPLT